MDSRQLFRYLFVYPKYWSQEERTAMPEFIRQFKENSRLNEIIIARGLHPLAEVLNLSFPTNSGIYNPVSLSFVHDNKRFKYFEPGQEVDEAQAIYTMALSICEILSRGDKRAFQSAYSMVVFFGDNNNPETMFTLFDEFCRQSNISNVNAAFDFPLPQQTTKIDLAAWRPIIRKSVLDNLRLLAIAAEVEAKLGHRAPASLEEANLAAQSRVFKNAAEAPELAELCNVNLAPEECFADLFNADCDQEKSLQNLWGNIPSTHKLQLLFLLPANVSLSARLKFVDLLEDNDKEEFFKKNQANIIHLCNESSISSLLQELQTPKSQQLLLSIMDKNLLDDLVKTFLELNLILSYLKRAHLCEQFLSLLGPTKLNVLVLTTNQLAIFFRTCLPEKNKLAMLLSHFDIEKLSLFCGPAIISTRATLSGRNCFKEILALLGEESYEFMVKLGNKHLIALLEPTPALLNDCLAVIPREKAFSFVTEVIGMPLLRKLIPYLEKQPYAQRDAFINAYIAEDQKEELQEAFLTATEKGARYHIQTKVINPITKKVLTPALYRGATIVLLDGTSIDVPKHAAELWQHVRAAFVDRTECFDNAWNAITDKASGAVNSWRVTSFTRAKETQDFYNALQNMKSQLLATPKP